MTSVTRFDSKLSAAWQAHEAAEKAVKRNTEAAALLNGRRRVAERFPGCAIAILSPDPMVNWDRGRLVQEIASSTPKTLENGGE